MSEATVFLLCTQYSFRHLLYHWLAGHDALVCAFLEMPLFSVSFKTALGIVTVLVDSYPLIPFRLTQLLGLWMRYLVLLWWVCLCEWCLSLAALYCFFILDFWYFEYIFGEVFIWSCVFGVLCCLAFLFCFVFLTWHKLETCENRKPQLRNFHHEGGLLA